jgi:peptidoglycan/LPS O-acetylase OafA/YrhL
MLTPRWVGGGRIPALDGLRALAVGLVLVEHSSLTNGFPGAGRLHMLGRLGTIGVDVFFVLSGFLITTLLCREFDRTGRVSLRGFYIRRALRILPAYCSLLLVVLAMSLAGAVHVPAADWVAAVTYTMNFRQEPVWEIGHIWSLSIEEHFYLAWPLVFLLVPRWAALRVLIAVLVLGPVARWAVILTRPDLSPTVELWTFVRLDSIAFGCLFALLARQDRGRRVLDLFGRYWPAALVSLVATYLLAHLSGKFSDGVAPSVTAGAIAILVWAAVRRAPRWLDHPVMVAVGVGSYSLYIWQQPFLNPHRDVWWTNFPQNLLLVALVATASYRLVERPFLQLKDSLGSGRSHGQNTGATT